MMKLTGSHATVPLQEYTDTGSHFPQQLSAMCPDHEDYNKCFFCVTCHAAMCTICNETKTCPKGAGGDEGHAVVKLHTASPTLKKIIQTEVEEWKESTQDLHEVMSKMEDGLADALELETQLSKEVDDHEGLLVAAVKSHMDKIRSGIRSAIGNRRAMYKQSLEKLKALVAANTARIQLGTTARNRFGAAQLEATLEEMNKIQPTPHPLIARPVGPTPKLELPDIEQVQDYVRKAVGALRLEPSIHHITIQQPITNVRTSECTSVVLPSGEEVIVEAQGRNGLHMRHSDGTTTRIEKESFWRVGVSPDGKTVYASRGSTEKNIFIYQFENEGNPWTSDVTKFRVAGAAEKYGFSVSPSGLLAVSNCIGASVMVYSPCGTPKGTVSESIRGEKVLQGPRHVDWSPDEKEMYIVDNSILCLTLQPRRLRWATELDDTKSIKYLGGFLYITHNKDRKVTVLDPRDGRLVRTVPTPGDVRGFKELSTGDIVMYNYSS